MSLLRRRVWWSTFAIALVIALVIARPSSVRASPAEDLTEAVEEGIAEEEPKKKAGSGDVLPALARLSNAAREANRTLSGFEKTRAMEASTEARKRVVEEFGRYISEQQGRRLQTTRLSTIRERLLVERERIGLLLADLRSRLDEISTIREDFAEREETWGRWRRELQSEEEYRQIRSSFREATAHIDPILERAPAVSKELLALQQHLLEIDEQAQVLVEEAERIVNERQAERLNRNAPSMFEPAYWVNEAPWSGWANLIDQGLGLSAAFFDRVFRVLLVHIGFAVGLFLFTRWVRRRDGESSWPVFAHPIALAAFVSTAVCSVLYEPMPVAWELVVWMTLAVSGVLLGRASLAPGREQGAVVVLATAYPALLLLDLLQPPDVVLRTVRIALCVVGALLAWRWGRTQAEAEAEEQAKRGWLRWIFRTAAVALGFSAVANVIGYTTLARFVTDSLVVSGFIALSSLVLVRLLKSVPNDAADDKAPGFWERVLRRGLRRTATLARYCVMVVGFFYVGHAWEVLPSPLDVWRMTAQAVSVLGIELSGEAILLAVAIVAVTLEVSWLIQTALESSVSRDRRHPNAPQTIESVKKLIHYALLILGILFALTAIGVRLSSLAIVAGALGVGIGFGLQNIAHDIVSGIVLLFEQPVRIGDTIVVGDRFGIVKKIGLRSTVVILPERTEFVVPNRKLTDDPVVNWTLSANKMGLFVPIGVAYGSDTDAVISTLREVAEEHDEVVSSSTEILFIEFGDSVLSFELRVVIRNPRNRLQVRSEILLAIDRKFRAHGIEIAFPQRDLHVRSIDAKVAEALGRGMGPRSPEVSAPAPSVPEPEPADPD